MTDMDPLQMQIEMLKAQVETQKNMYRQMYASDPAVVEHRQLRIRGPRRPGQGGP